MKKFGLPDHHHLLPARIGDDSQHFQSKVFLIRYCEEEVDLHDTIVFRVEIDSKQADQELILEVDLHFADLNPLGGAENWKEHWRTFHELVEFKKMQSQQLLIRGAAKSIVEHCPVTFEGNCFSVLNL